MLTETLRRDELVVLVSLSSEVQINEQEKCKSRQKRNLDTLLTSAQQGESDIRQNAGRLPWGLLTPIPNGL